MINIDKILFMVLGLVVLIFVFLLGRGNKNDIIQSYESIISAEKKKSESWKDEAKLWHSKAQVAEIKNKDVMKLLSKTDSTLANLHQEFQGVKKNLRNISYAGWVATKSNYEFSAKSIDTIYIINKDTATVKKFTYKDPSGWYTARGIILPSDYSVPYVSISPRDSFVTVLTRKGRFLRSPLYFQEIKSYNPNTEVTYNKAVIVHREKKFLGLF